MNTLKGPAAASSYNADIGGLRALAIGAVLLFHFDLLGAGGGFVGVDVFFVISGFLMTSMLGRASGKPLSLGAFYERRLWRIAPALLAACAISLAAGLALMLPMDVERLGLSAGMSIFFASNFFFASGVGYFDTAAIYKPLLHTWSLSVEMQFYLVWPFVMLAIGKLRQQRRIIAMAAIFALSFAACQILAVTDPKAAFFSLPARLWEFALGALVALDGGAGLRSRLRPFAPALRWLALAIVALSPWLVGEDALWPAPWALPACLGAAFLILTSDERTSLPSRLLASPPFDFIGRISYSLYLVHWPVIVFVGYSQFPQTPLWLRVASLAACVPLAMLLYSFVENPLRGMARAPRRRPAFAALAGAALLASGVGYAAHLHPAAMSRLAAPEAADAPLNAFACAPWRAPGADRDFCKIGDPAAAPSALLWGDSHAMHFAAGFAARLAESGGAMVVALRDSCPPVVGVSRVSNTINQRTDCPRDNAQALAAALASPQIATVVIAARWAFYLETTRFGAEKGGSSFIISGDSRSFTVDTSRRLLESGLDAEIGALTQAGKRVILLGQAPEMGLDAARCVVMKRLAHEPESACDIARARVDARQAFASAMLARIVGKYPGVSVVDPLAVLCDDAVCHATLNGRPAYRDDNHLSASAARAIVRQLPSLAP